MKIHPFLLFLIIPLVLLAGQVSMDRRFIPANPSSGVVRVDAQSQRSRDANAIPASLKEMPVHGLQQLSDAASPNVILATAVSSPTNSAAILVTATFDVVVSDFELADIATTNASVTDLSGSGTAYTFTLAPILQGLFDATVSAGTVHDIDLNPNSASNTLSLTYDSIAPAVTIEQASGQADPTNTPPVSFTVLFSEPISDFATGDISLAGTALATTGVVSGDGETYTVTVSGMSHDGTVLASIDAGVAHDAAGNANGGSTSIDNVVTYDLTGPVATLTTTAISPTKSTSISVSVSFDEAVADFELGDIATFNASASDLSGSGTTYTFTLPPTLQGVFTAAVTAGTVHDAAGNPNPVSNTISLTFDSVGPTVTLTLQPSSDTGSSSTDNLTNIASLVFNAAFNEPVSIPSAGSFTKLGSAGGCVFTVGAAAGNTYPVTASSCSEGTLQLQLAADAVTDLAGNGNVQTPGSVVTIDRTAPTVSFDLQPGFDFGPSATDNLTNAASPVIDAIFGEAIYGFAASDVTNIGTSTCVITLGSALGNTYPVIASSCSVGTLIPQLIAGRISDIAGNGNDQTDGLVVTLERTAPTVTFDLQAGSDLGASATDNLTSASALVYDAVFLESVYGLDPGDLSNGGGASGCTFTVGTANVNTYALIASGCLEGTVTLRLSAGGLTDVFGNVNDQANAPLVTIDRTAPTVTFDLQDAYDSGTSTTDNLTNVPSPVFMAAFSEPVTGFAPLDLANTGTAAACSFGVGTPSGNSYLVAVSSCSSGTLVIRLAVSGVMDTAGNNNLQATGPTVTIDRVIPTVVFDLRSASDSGSSNTDNLTNAGTLIYDATFSKPVLGFAATDLSFGGSASACSVVVGVQSGNTYPLTVSSCLPGTVILQLIATAVADAAGNANLLILAPSVGIDRTNPSVHWTGPVTDGGVFPVSNQMVQLQVQVTDAGYSSGINQVIFNRWSPDKGIYFEIGRVTNSPYNILFDPSVLTLFGHNQFDAKVYDTAGNSSPVSTIWLDHLLSRTYLPIISHP